jgi:hypothetical protein
MHCKHRDARKQLSEFSGQRNREETHLTTEASDSSVRVRAKEV